MSVCGPLGPEGVVLGLAARTRGEVLTVLAERSADARGLDAGTVLRALADREALGSTGVGAGVAMPHATVAGLTVPFVVVARLAAAIDWPAIDGDPVDLVILVLSAANGPASLDLIAPFARRLRSPELRARLRAAASAEAFSAALDAAAR